MDTPIWLERIRATMNARGYTQREVGRRANLGSSLVSDLVNGRKTPKLDTFIAVCDALEVSTAFILEGIAVTPDSERLLRAWNSLPESQQDAVLALIDSRPGKKSTE